jgi:hypothetical protein
MYSKASGAASAQEPDCHLGDLVEGPPAVDVQFRG